MGRGHELCLGRDRLQDAGRSTQTTGIILLSSLCLQRCLCEESVMKSGHRGRGVILRPDCEEDEGEGHGQRYCLGRSKAQDGGRGSRTHEIFVFLILSASAQMIGGLRWFGLTHAWPSLLSCSPFSHTILRRVLIFVRFQAPLGIWRASFTHS